MRKRDACVRDASDSNRNKTLSLLFGVITIIFIFIVFIFIGNKYEALKSFICLALIKVKSARRKVFELDKYFILYPLERMQWLVVFNDSERTKKSPESDSQDAQVLFFRLLWLRFISHVTTLGRGSRKKNKKMP